MLSEFKPLFLSPEKSVKTNCAVGAVVLNIIVDSAAFIHTSMRHSVEFKVVTFIEMPEIVDVDVDVDVGVGVGVGVGALPL